jgi:sorbose reductase
MTIINGKKADWENIIQTNYTSIVYQASLLGSVWQAQGSGNLIITASGAATSTIRPTNQTLYNSSKAAAKSLARSLAQEFKDFARVNSVSRTSCRLGAASVGAALTFRAAGVCNDASPRLPR